VSNNLLQAVEISRVTARDKISETIKKLEEQYFTPARVAQIMARLFTAQKNRSLTVLDPCSGVGNLAAAVYQYGVTNRENQSLTLIERDRFLYESCKENFRSLNNFTIFNKDFFEVSEKLPKFDRIILNPPYAKLKSDTELAKNCIITLGHSEPNLYSAFISYCLNLLTFDGELVAIVPRSFCNGALFKNFRKNIYDNFYLNEFYLFESRKIFSDSNVLQEVIILKISRKNTKKIKITHENKEGKTSNNSVSTNNVIFPNDLNRVIHIPMAEGDKKLLSRISKFQNTLESLGLRASTGKVVDFRCEDLLNKNKTSTNVELIYQDNIAFSENIKFLNDSAKSRFIEINNKSKNLLLHKNNYILVRRISFKESPTRIIASPLLKEQFPSELIGIENHVNYIWGPKRNITKSLCIALSAYLSSKTIDQYVRRFSGHTQINATDLNSLPIPRIEALESFYLENNSLTLPQLIEVSDKYFFK